MATSLFPSEMMKTTPSMSLEDIASSLMHFENQLQILHWQTNVYAEHVALGVLYEYVHTFKDDVVEKIMGYTGKKPKNIKLSPFNEYTALPVLDSLCDFAYSLYEWAGKNRLPDIENMAQSLSGEAAKTKYLLTLS